MNTATRKLVAEFVGTFLLVFSRSAPQCSASPRRWAWRATVPATESSASLWLSVWSFWMATPSGGRVLTSTQP